MTAALAKLTEITDGTIEQPCAFDGSRALVLHFKGGLDGRELLSLALTIAEAKRLAWFLQRAIVSESRRKPQEAT